MNKQLTILKKNLSSRPIRTVKDLIRATVPKNATLSNGGYDLFAEEIKKYVITKRGRLMLWEDWYNMPHPMVSKTEDAEYEITGPDKINITINAKTNPTTN